MRALPLLLLGLTPLAPPPAAVGPPAPAVTPELRNEAQEYARQMIVFAGEIRDKYVRKLDRADLLVAGVTALYEAVQRPVPPGLRDEIARADEFEILHVLARHRETVGQSEALIESKALLVSLQGMAKLLDPHSGLVRREEFANRPTDSRQFGSGLALEGATAPATAAWRMPPRGGLPLPPPIPGAGVAGSTPVPPAGTPWVVRTVFPGSPAQRAGLRPGDRITHVNGRPTDTADAPKLAADLFPTEEAEGRPPVVRLSVRRGGEALALALTPDYFDVETVFGVSRKADNSWDFMLDRQRKIGFVRIGTLGRGTADDLDAAIENLESNGMRGLILDLRACPGGLLNSAIDVTRCFLKSGTIASVVNRNGEVEQRYGTEGSVRRVPNQVCTVPLVVLIGNETIGGGELIAGALQDNGRARLAGRRTFGKATVQSGEPLDLPATDYVFRYSTGLFVRPSGKNLQRFPEFKSSDEWGIRPDPALELPVSPSLAKQLHEWYDLQALRPGGNRAALPLDDPANDPLRQMAVRELIRQFQSKDVKPWLIVRR